MRSDGNHRQKEANSTFSRKLLCKVSPNLKDKKAPTGKEVIAVHFGFV